MNGLVRTSLDRSPSTGSTSILCTTVEAETRPSVDSKAMVTLISDFSAFPTLGNKVPLLWYTNGNR